MLIWKIQNLFSQTNIYDEIHDGIFLGRKCQYSQLPANTTIVVDLTAEFYTSYQIREKLKLYCLPTLDGSTPDLSEYQRVINTILKNSEETIYIHCANGVGRSAIFMAALLIQKGVANSPQESLQIIRNSNRKIRPNKSQIHYLEVFYSQPPHS